MRRLLLFSFAAMLPFMALAEDEIKWGSPVNGLRIGIEGAPSSATSDQDLTFKIIAQNVSQQPIVLPTPDTFLLRNDRSDDFHETPLSPVITRTKLLLTFSYKAGVFSDNGPTLESLHAEVITIAPGQSVTWDHVPLEEHFYIGNRLPSDHRTAIGKSFLLPDDLYHIRFRYENDQTNVADQAVWSGQIDSGVVDIQVNPPSTEGIKLSGGFSIPKQTYFLGEPIEAIFTVTNEGDAPIRFPVGGDYRGTGRHERYTIYAVDEHGVGVSDPVSPSNLGGGLGGDAKLKPSESYTEKVLLNQWCAFSKPGKYKITCKRILNIIRSDQKSDIHSKPESSLPSVPIETTLEVTLEDNPSTQTGYIAGLIPALLRNDDSSNDAANQLKTLAQSQTPAAFPEIVKLLDGPATLQPQAVQWLSYYGSEKAAPILLEKTSKLAPLARELALSILSKWSISEVEPLLAAALRDPDHELRASTVLICTREWYGSCVPILLTMDTDPDPIVRRYLGEALGASGDAQAIPVLLRLLHDPDPDPYIKIWAAEGLGKFNRMDGVPVMIDLLQDPKIGNSQGNITQTLQDLTGKNFNDNRTAWLAWWDQEGRSQYAKP